MRIYVKQPLEGKTELQQQRTEEEKAEALVGGAGLRQNRAQVGVGSKLRTHASGKGPGWRYRVVSRLSAAQNRVYKIRPGTLGGFPGVEPVENSRCLPHPPTLRLPSCPLDSQELRQVYFFRHMKPCLPKLPLRCPVPARSCFSCPLAPHKLLSCCLGVLPFYLGI